MRDHVCTVVRFFPSFLKGVSRLAENCRRQFGLIPLIQCLPAQILHPFFMIFTC